MTWKMRNLDARALAVARTSPARGDGRDVAGGTQQVAFPPHIYAQNKLEITAG
jgi:hypothetical protein